MKKFSLLLPQLSHNVGKISSNSPLLKERTHHHPPFLKGEVFLLPLKKRRRGDFTRAFQTAEVFCDFNYCRGISLEVY